MLSLNKENVILLPKDRESCRAPSCFSNDLWFDLKKWDSTADQLDNDIIDVLITKGIGWRKCPTNGEDAAFCIVSGIITSITGKYVVFQEKAHPIHEWRTNENFTWEVLWNAAEQHRNDIDQSFLASVLRSFMPRQHDPCIDRPYYESLFVGKWRFLAYPLTFSRDSQHICEKHIKRGKKALQRLSPAVAESVRKAAYCVPTTLKIFADHVQRL